MVKYFFNCNCETKKDYITYGMDYEANDLLENSYHSHIFVDYNLYSFSHSKEIIIQFNMIEINNS